MFSTKYNLESSYEANLESAYREFSDYTASAEDIKNASKHSSLWVDFASIPWFMGSIPLDAIKPWFVADFLPKDNKVVYCANSLAMNQRVAESEESQATRETQESLMLETDPDVSDDSEGEE